MRLGICDDNDVYRKLLLKWIISSFPLFNESNVFDFGSGKAVIEFLYHQPLDILILDCKMPGLDGIETAKKIREIDRKLIIIALTDYEQYAILGYEFDIFGYLLKSHLKQRFGEILDAAVKRVLETQNFFYQAKSGKESIQLQINEVLYLESFRRKKDIVLIDGNSHYFSYDTMVNLERIFTPHGFIRPHRSYLVNGKYVRRINHMVIELTQGIKLPVSRSYYKSAFDSLTLHSAKMGG